MIAKFIRRVLDNGSPEIFGTGEQSRDWTYVTDVVDAIYKAVMLPESAGELIHVASGVAHSVHDVARQVIRSCGKEDRVEPVFVDARPGEVRRSCGDASKAARMLRWNPRISFEEGLRRTIDYYSARRRTGGIARDLPSPLARREP